jgi:hypothetical protein
MPVPGIAKLLACLADRDHHRRGVDGEGRQREVAVEEVVLGLVTGDERQDVATDLVVLGQLARRCCGARSGWRAPGTTRRQIRSAMSSGLGHLAFFICTRRPSSSIVGSMQR